MLHMLHMLIPSGLSKWISSITIQNFCACVCFQAHFASLSRCDSLWRGGFPVASLAATFLGAPGTTVGQSSWEEGGSQEPGEAEEDLLSPAAGSPPSATVERAEQRPGQAVWLHTRYKIRFTRMLHQHKLGFCLEKKKEKRLRDFRDWPSCTYVAVSFFLKVQNTGRRMFKSSAQTDHTYEQRLSVVLTCYFALFNISVCYFNFCIGVLM